MTVDTATFEDLDLYKILKLSETATEKEIKKSYYTLSLQFHPDRSKSDTTTLFQQISFAYEILSDPKRRDIYNKSGSTRELDLNEDGRDWDEYFRTMFSNLVTPETIAEYEKTYKGSEIEKQDIIKAYNDGKGSIKYMLEYVPLLRADEEMRVRKIIDGEVESGNLELFKKYKFSQKAMDARIKKEQQEAIECEEMEKEKENNGESSLLSLIQSNKRKLNDTFSALEEKYTKLENEKKGKGGKATKGKGGKGKKGNEPIGEPSEEDFARARERMKGSAK